MEIDRRRFLAIAASAALAGGQKSSSTGEEVSGGGGQYMEASGDGIEGIDAVHIGELPESYSSGEEMEIEAYGAGPGFDRMIIEYRREGDDSWIALMDETAFRHDGYTEARLADGYTLEGSGTYRFRARAGSGEGFVASEEEVVEFVDEIDLDLDS